VAESVPELEGASVKRAGRSWLLLPVVLLGILGALGVTGGASGARTAASNKVMTIYSVATLASFLNHEDDRQRSALANPFNADQKALTPHDTGNGPFAGDQTLFSFNLFSSPSLKKKIGTAVYTCDYNFNKHALCIATYTLNNGTLLATGDVDFNAGAFTLALNGGTKTYLNANGQVAMTTVASTKNVQKLSFLLLAS
jgi:hypothetical protein